METTSADIPIGDPGDEATLEFCVVERRETVAEVVVRWRSMVEPETDAERYILLAKSRNIDEGPRPAHKSRTVSTLQNTVACNAINGKGPRRWCGSDE
jgi:hypothetical protein